MKNLFVFLTLLAFSCDSPLKSGLVISKYYEEEQTTTRTQYDFVMKQYLPITVWDDEDFILVVASGTDTQRVKVEQDVFNAFSVGDLIQFKY